MQIDPISLQSIASAASTGTTQVAETQTQGASFENWMMKQIQSTNSQIIESDNAVRDLAMGEAQSLHGVMMSLESAKLSFELVVQVRNRLVEAYQEVLRMRI